MRCGRESDPPQMLGEWMRKSRAFDAQGVVRWGWWGLIGVRDRPNESGTLVVLLSPPMHGVTPMWRKDFDHAVNLSSMSCDRDGEPGSLLAALASGELGSRLIGLSRVAAAEHRLQVAGQGVLRALTQTGGAGRVGPEYANGLDVAAGRQREAVP